ncbi:MAG: hypothetical protein ACXVAY_15485 [Mucilaginibacter sp.]
MAIVFTFLLSQSILLPLVAVLIYLKKIPPNWMPFIWLIIVAFLTEEVSFIAIAYFKAGNAPIIKIYSLIECCLILYQFRLWKNENFARTTFWILTGICIAGWIVENIIFGELNTFSPFFRVFYAFVVVLISINQINAIIVRQDGPLLKNPKIILALSFIIFFIYQIIYEASYFIGSETSIVANKIILGFGYINFAVNILYVVVILLINKNDEVTFKSHYLK